MKYKALTSFSGSVSMSKDEVMEISNKEISEDLLKAGYIEAVEEVKNETKRVRAKRDM